MSNARHLPLDELGRVWESLKSSPHDDGRIEMIVRRPDVDQRDDIVEGTLDVDRGLLGDNWSRRPSRKTRDGSPLGDAQITIMNSRVIDVIAGGKDRWALAGDQFFVDLDLSEENLPPGTRLGLGGAELVVTGVPHTGCAKFAARFGTDALKFINTPDGRANRLRGLYARVVKSGDVRRGDTVRKLPPA